VEPLIKSKFENFHESQLKMVSTGIVRQINYTSVLYLYPVVSCGVESSQLKLLTLRYECVVPRNGIVAKHRSLGDDLSSPLSCVSETVDP